MVFSRWQLPLRSQYRVRSPCLRVAVTGCLGARRRRNGASRFVRRIVFRDSLATSTKIRQMRLSDYTYTIIATTYQSALLTLTIRNSNNTLRDL